MAEKKDGCLAWIIVVCAFIAWLSSGREDRPTVTSTTTIDRSTTAGSSSWTPSSPASSPKTQELSTPAVGPSVLREAPVPAAAQATERPAVQNPRSRMSTTANVRLRSSDEADGPVITTLKKGTAVEVVRSTDDRVQVIVPSLNVIGWVHRNYLTDAAPSLRSASAFAATEQDAPKAAAQKATPKPSKPAPGTPVRDPVSGSCDCPYDYARNGSLCGGRSAYSRPGGREPICYY